MIHIHIGLKGIYISYPSIHQHSMVYDIALFHIYN